MDTLLYQYNPWWEADFSTTEIRRRDAKVYSLMGKLDEKRAVFLSGLRRVGKTTLMRLTVDALLHKNVPASHIFYVSLDDYLLKDVNILEILDEYRRLHKLRIDQRVYVFLDEVTAKEEYQVQIKNLLDRQRVVILACSSSASLLKDHRAFLTGRAITYEIQPLSFHEYLEFREITIAKRDEVLLDSYFRDYIRDGGLPENVLKHRRDYLMGLVDDIIQKDIIAFYSLRNYRVVRDYFSLLMERSGKQVSINKISRILKISPDTAKRYLQYFEDAFLIHTVPRYGNTNEMLLSPKKLYTCDLGIMHLFIGDRDFGSYFENCVYLMMRNFQEIYYLKQNGIELDFFTADKTLIEAKYNTTIKGAQKEFYESFNARHKYCITSVKQLDLIRGLWKNSTQVL